MSTHKEIRFVCRDFPGGGDECVFIEIENEEGKSVKAGEWRKRDDGFVESRSDGETAAVSSYVIELAVQKEAGQ